MTCATQCAGSGRSFTAYVFSKADSAQHAQQALLADASAAQLASPQQQSAQRVVAESPSPIATPDGATVSRILAGSECTVRLLSSNDAAEDISTSVGQRTAEQAVGGANQVECSGTDHMGLNCILPERRPDAHCTAEEQSERRDVDRPQLLESIGEHFMFVHFDFLTRQ